ncbi:MAG TPA: pilus assembly protein PilM [Solirubrobacteraceae bacterium]|nr:pilus assembly protein PilM [Solirubrobacteraceae bacterium]
MRLPTGIPNVKLPRLGARSSSGADVVGLDIQPGFVAAVEARVNGSIVAQRAASSPLAADTMRDGEVLDDLALAEVLRDMFRDSGLGKRVRVGVANQRTVLRTLELPPVSDEKELAAAITFQAQDHVPMPLNNAVLDFHALGVVDTPAGPRQRVVLVAAQRDMIERLLAGVRAAGLTPAGVDLSAFALIRSLYRRDPEETGRVLYLNVDGLTNLAIADGPVCRFTRVVGSGLEGMAIELAERRGIALAEARDLLAAIDLTVPPSAAETATQPVTAPQDGADSDDPEGGEAPAEGPEAAAVEPAGPDAHEDPVPVQAPALVGGADADVWSVLENGVRDIAGEVRNSLDFHRSQDEGGEVSHVVLSGAAEAIPGFAESLQLALGVEVRPRAVGVADGDLAPGSEHRLAIAAGLAAAEAPQ